MAGDSVPVGSNYIGSTHGLADFQAAFKNQVGSYPHLSDIHNHYIYRAVTVPITNNPKLSYLK